MRRWKEPAARTGIPAPGSSGARTSLAPRSAAVRSARAETSSLRRPTTRTDWSRSTASFSAAISTSVSPSHSVWSRPTEVSTVTREGITLVASRRPPSPASITAASTRAAARATKAAAVATSNWVTTSPSGSERLTTSAASAVRATDALKASGAISSPWMRTRSAQREKWGEMQAPAPTPCASSRAAVICTTEDLPLVPTTCTEAKRCWGIPSRVVSRCILSSPSFQPIGCREPR